MELNPNVTLGQSVSALVSTGCWVKENTAMLVVHGIGNQLPLETLDQFGRGLIAEYAMLNKVVQFSLEHVVMSKPSDNGNGTWFDNVVDIPLDSIPVIPAQMGPLIPVQMGPVGR